MAQAAWLHRRPGVPHPPPLARNSPRLFILKFKRTLYTLHADAVLGLGLKNLGMTNTSLIHIKFLIQVQNIGIVRQGQQIR